MYLPQLASPLSIPTPIPTPLIFQYVDSIPIYNSQSPHLLCGLLSLEVVVSTVSNGTTDENDSVETDAEASGVGVGVGGRGGGGGMGLGLRVTGHTLHATNEQTVENLTRLVGVADILEGLGAILASDVQEDFLTTGVLIDEAGAIVDLVVNDHVEVLLGVVAGDLLEGEFL